MKFLEFEPLEMDQVQSTMSSLTYPPIEFYMPSNISHYNSTWNFKTAGMDPLYKISLKTLNAIFPEDSQQYFEYYGNYSADFTNLTNSNITRIVLENKGPLIYVAVSALFLVILTLFGIGWCFYKCCCSSEKSCCVRRKEPEELIAAKLVAKRDKFKRGACGFLFSILIIVFMFGLVCCFVTNEYIHAAKDELPKDIDTSLDDAEIYLDTTKAQIDALFVKNYDILQVKLVDILHKSGEIIKNGLSEKTGAEALDSLEEVLDNVENVRVSLQNVQLASKSLVSKAQQLKSGINRAKIRLLDILDRCELEKCKELRSTSEIRALKIENNFTNLPDMSEILNELGTLLGTNVRESIKKGRRVFDLLSIKINQKVLPMIPEVIAKINKTGNELREVSLSLIKALDSVPIPEIRRNVFYVNEKYVQKYEPFRYYATLGISSVLAFIFTMMTFGIFIGCCGKQPPGTDECCSRKTGSSFLNCGIFFMFLTGGLLTIAATFLFISAGALTQIGCDSLVELDNRTETALKIPKIQIDTKYKYKVPPYHKILKACKEGKSAYRAFELQSVYNVDGVMELSDRFRKEVSRLADQVSLPEDSTGQIVFLTPEAKEQMERFADSKINAFDFARYANELLEKVTTVDLSEIIKRLNQLNASFNDFDFDSIDGSIKSDLMNEIMFLESLQTKVLIPIKVEVNKSAENLFILADEQKDLTERIKQVGIAAERAQDMLQSTDANILVKELAKKYENEFANLVDSYATFANKQIEEKVGECSPLYNAYNSSTSSFCVKIGYPLSGFWFALSCLVLLFFPLIIISIHLAGLYSKFKTHAYESETYYSAYNTDGDTIPLSANNAPRRNNHNKRGRSQITGANDARYHSRFDDTSHKAWGSQMYSNHHTPPTSGDYERFMNIEDGNIYY